MNLARRVVMYSLSLRICFLVILIAPQSHVKTRPRFTGLARCTRRSAGARRGVRAGSVEACSASGPEWNGISKRLRGVMFLCRASDAKLKVSEHRTPPLWRRCFHTELQARPWMLNAKTCCM